MTNQKNKKRLVRARMAKTGESHQAAHRAVSRAVEVSPVSGGGASTAESMLGTVVAGRYKLLRVVPASKVPLAGGPGSEPPWVLFDAKHLLLGGDVTIKLLIRPTPSERTLRPWLLREGRALQRAAHLDVIKVFDIGETEDETLYLVLERAPAMTLGAYLQARSMDERVALDVVGQLAHLLAHLQERGVTPRGLRSGVIHLEARGGTLAVKIGSLPFAELAGDPDLGRPDAEFAHPGWMSPEECRGERPDERSALYALGIALYAMLARRLPFEHEERARVLEMQRREAPRPPRAPAAEASALDAICLKLLAKNPEGRYETPAALVEALRRVSIP